MMNEIFLTDISGFIVQTCYSTIHSLKQVVHWSNIGSSDSGLKLFVEQFSINWKKDITNVFHFNYYLN